MSSRNSYKLDQVGIRMVKEPPLYSSEPVNSPEAAVRIIADTLRNYDREVFCVVNLRNDLKPINVNVVSVGTLNASIAHPREILKSTILSNAAAVMLLHNHPSGNLTPSREDIELTARMQEICTMLGTPVQDHIIVGNDDRYFSFREQDILQIARPLDKDLSDINLKGVAEPEVPFTAFKPDEPEVKKRPLEEITDQLEKGVQEIFESDKYKTWLSTMSKFHHYSLNNTILIAIQRPDATSVAGYQAWKRNFGRQVRKGEKGIKIIAPSPYKVKTEQDKIDPYTHMKVLDSNGDPVKEVVEVERPAFRVATVFDVSQTDGKELPTLGVDELSGQVNNFSMFFEALKQTSPVPVEFEDIKGGAKGYYHVQEQRIAIQEGMSETQTIKTAIHEITHATLHSAEKLKAEGVQKSSQSKEVEAESVAYTICQHYGIDTSDYSFAYIAGWSSGKETAELKESMETIRSTASDLINRIDGHLEALMKVHETAIEQPAVQNSVLGALQQLSSENAADHPTEYRYQCNHRPPGPGAVPKEGLEFCDDNGTGRYGDVVYNRPLTDKELKNFELDPVKGVKRTARDPER